MFAWWIRKSSSTHTAVRSFHSYLEVELTPWMLLSSCLRERMRGPEYECGAVYTQPFELRGKCSDSESHCPQDISNLAMAIWFSSFHSRNRENNQWEIFSFPQMVPRIFPSSEVYFSYTKWRYFRMFSVNSHFWVGMIISNLLLQIAWHAYISHPFCDHPEAKLVCK